MDNPKGLLAIENNKTQISDDNGNNYCSPTASIKDKENRF
jgi:hypothetical protein